MTEAYMSGGNCDSCCPRCKQRESHGNGIFTSVDREHPQLDRRTCTTCEYSWIAEFTPAGFVPMEKPR